MSDIYGVISGVIARSAAREEPGDYYMDGLLYCGRCRTPKQCVADFDEPVIVGCTCLCEQEKIRAEAALQKRRERMLEIRNLRVQGIQDNAVRRYTFASARMSGNLEKCRKYVDRWEEMLAHNNGLLFWGDAGTGKTFAAACIANALIDRSVPVLMTSFLKILNLGEWDKNEIVQQMKRFPLLVIDDLGAERQNSEYALEIVELVVDERYKTQKPLIVTTNLTRQELERPKNMGYKRVYSRVLEMCVPVEFSGTAYRQEKAKDKMRFAREVFG